MARHRQRHQHRSRNGRWRELFLFSIFFFEFFSDNSSTTWLCQIRLDAKHKQRMGQRTWCALRWPEKSRRAIEWRPPTAKTISINGLTEAKWQCRTRTHSFTRTRIAHTTRAFFGYLAAKRTESEPNASTPYICIKSKRSPIQTFSLSFRLFRWTTERKSHSMLALALMLTCVRRGLRPCDSSACWEFFQFVFPFSFLSHSIRIFNLYVCMDPVIFECQPIHGRGEKEPDGRSNFAKREPNRSAPDKASWAALEGKQSME